MIVVERRASGILYNLLRSRRDARPVLVPANTCWAVPLTLVTAGRAVRLVDIDEPSLVIDPGTCLRLVRRALGRYGGLVFVRPYGAELDAEPFFRALKAAQPDLLLVDDRCLGPPDPDGARLAPSADATLFSTALAKHVDLGGGGFAYLAPGVPYRRHRRPFSPLALARAALRCQHAVRTGRAFPTDAGAWLDLGPPPETWRRYRARILAALPGVEAHKRRLNAIYERELPAGTRRLAPGFQTWRYQVLVPRPAALLARLFAAGLFASRHYPSLGRALGGGSFPAAERLHRSVVNLFNDLHYDEARARRTVAVVHEHGRDRGGAGAAAGRASVSRRSGGSRRSPGPARAPRGSRRGGVAPAGRLPTR